jgi:hypothetical protein
VEAALNTENVPPDVLRSLRRSAALLLAGQLLYVAVTLFHADGPANDHRAVFAEYAASGTWTAVHVAQFACMAIMLAGLLGLSFALESRTTATAWTVRFGAASAVTAFALYGVVLAVDGVALKQAVNAWAGAPEAEKTARFAAAEAVRWLEWGARSYQDFTLGLAVLLFAIAFVRTARVPRPVPSLMTLSAIAYFGQGWLAGVEGFSSAHTIAIVAAEILNATWMTWLLVFARRAHR